MSLVGGLRNALGGVLGQIETTVLPGLLSKALAGTSVGSLQGLLNRLREAGLGPQVASWLGSGPNLPITAAQLEAVLGDDVVEKISTTLNVPPAEIFGFLADHLPALIDSLSSHGKLQQP